MENINLKEAKSRLFDHLAFAIALSKEKASKEKAKNSERQGWLRLMVSAVDSYGKLLASVQMDEIEARLERLESQGQPEVLFRLPEGNLLNRLRQQEQEATINHG